ncbi:piggyBac transposable element-derived protein 4-like [Leptopilina heterotoma]|uniref:piggyBac transposable element-derived protein 4-like n=1 Tax=Leptopilina heterotoma TaxID=63436 RepID=UPI001CA7C56C|nr:piggyBac transposable element-derived protein 4-like [Leptopilina heterotoma]
MDDLHFSDSDDSDSDEDFTLYYSSSDDSDSSCDESDMPLKDRWKKFRNNFSWVKDDNFNPTIHEFNDPKVGINSDCNFNSECKPIDIFKYFYSLDVMEMICAMTNIYHSSKLDLLNESNILKGNSRILSWKNISVSELYTYYGLVILMGLIKKPSYEMYWSNDPLLFTPVFGQYMSLKRFQAISRYLHYSEDESIDKLRKIRPLFEMMIEKFKIAYRPGEKISIDESLLKFKGRLSFKQCNLSKRSRFGIKIYKCCDSVNGYIYNASVYIGKDPEDESKMIGISGKVVMKLLDDLNGQGRILFIDNWYSSPTLFAKLYEQKNNVIGTVRTNRKKMPITKGMKLNKLARNTVVTFHSNNLLVVIWKDKKVVTMLSTLPGSEFIETGRTDHKTGQAIKKPKVVAIYNSNMGGVDKCDQIIKPYEVQRKTYRWYQKVALNLLDMAIFNANIVYNILHNDEKKSHCEFRLQLAREILQEYGVQRKTAKKPRNKKTSQTHKLTKIPSNGKIKRKRLRCEKCSEKKIRTDTTWICNVCEMPLCKSCFDEMEKHSE